MNQTFMKVYKIVAEIPEGFVASYGQIAAMLGMPRGARVVGWAMRATPEYMNLPCHRVVSQSGKLAPEFVFGGQELQRSLLEGEGVTFKLNGAIDMERHQWKTL